jgi:hypothetical protein
MSERNPNLWLQGRADHTAEQDRALLEMLWGGREGVAGETDLAVSERGAGANMSVDVAAGRATVKGDENADQGMYVVWNDDTKNLTISAADPTNARRDIIVARVRDAFYSGATNAWALEVLTGTPAGSPSDPTIPDNCLPLARVAVAASATSITDANITDLRPSAAALGGTVVCTSTTRPTVNLYNGLSIFETDTKLVYTYEGGSWWPHSIFQQAPSVCCSRTTVQSIGDASTVAIQFNAADIWDTHNFHDTSTNNTRITIPTGLGGRYLVWGVAGFANNATGTRIIRFLVNGSTTYEVFRTTSAGVWGGAATIGMSLNAGDYIEMGLYQSSGGSLNTNVTSQVTQFGVTFMGRS